MGITQGELLLRQDPARERTHYLLMRLHYLGGDRAAAIRQFQRCAAALQKELGVSPSRRTLEFYNQVLADKLEGNGDVETRTKDSSAGEIDRPPVLSRLRAIRLLLAKVEHRLDREIREVDRALSTSSSGARRH